MRHWILRWCFKVKKSFHPVTIDKKNGGKIFEGRTYDFFQFSISVSPKIHSFNVFQYFFDEESKNHSLEGLRACIKDLLGKLTSSSKTSDASRSLPSNGATRYSIFKRAELYTYKLLITEWTSVMICTSNSFWSGNLSFSNDNFHNLKRIHVRLLLTSN